VQAFKCTFIGKFLTAVMGLKLPAGLCDTKLKFA